MPHYERLFPLAVLACLAVGALSYAVGESTKAMLDFLAVGLGVKLDDRLRQRWWGLGETSGPRWQRMRTPS
jgi:hypothetical protein